MEKVTLSADGANFVYNNKQYAPIYKTKGETYVASNSGKNWKDYIVVGPESLDAVKKAVDVDVEEFSSSHHDFAKLSNAMCLRDLLQYTPTDVIEVTWED